MIAIVRAVPMWAWALLAALLWGGFQHHRATAAGQRALQAQRELADLRADASATTVKTLTKAIAGQQEAIREAQSKTDAADHARRTVAGALGGLLERNRAAQRISTPATAAGASAPAGAGPDVCADMLGRIGRAAGRYADIADRARIAGQACERSYEALTPGPS